MSAFDVIKQHPYIAGGAVLGTVVVVFMFSGSGDKGTAVVPSGGVQSDPNTAALLSAQVNAGVRNNEISAQLEALNIQADAARHTADMEYGVKLNDSNNAADVAKSTLSTQQTLGLATISATQVMHLDDNATVRYQIQQSSEEKITESNNAKDIALDTNRSMVTINSQNAAVKTAADLLASQTANHSIDAAAAVARYNADTQVVLNREWAAHEERTTVFNASQLQVAAQTNQAYYASQVAIAQANNNHGSVGLGPFGFSY